MNVNAINTSSVDMSIYKGKSETQRKEEKGQGHKQDFIRDSAGTRDIKIYKKPDKKVDQTTIAALIKDSEEAYDHLRRLVEDLLKRQGYGWDAVLNGHYKNVEVDEKARSEAAELISENGILGAEKVSDRIVQFAIAISGGDKTRIDEIIGAIDKGFKEAERILGGLPEVSVKTYNMIMEKLDRWVNEGTAE